MTGDGSAFAALGLEPDADSSDIEQAYRRLIKQHHPDREGGDGVRAAEINRAYRELRGQRDLKDPLELHEEWPKGQRQGWLWVALALLLGGIGTALLFSMQPPHVGDAQGIASPKPSSKLRRDAVQREPMEQPLNLGAIDASARDALRLSNTRDEMALATSSRDCHRLLRSDPTLLQLDRCVAFDDAVVQLQDRDPLRDQGPFSELAVTGRVWSGASALSQDSLAIDARLDRIRMRVELALTPQPSVQPSLLSAGPSLPPPGTKPSSMP